MWAAIYGLAGGCAAIGCQEAADAGHPAWVTLFAALTIADMPVFFALHWRQLAG